MTRGSRSLLAVGLLASLCFATKPVWAQGLPLDAFLCYDVKDKGFHEIDLVNVADQFNTMDYDVVATRELCTPAAAFCGCKGECPTPAITDPATHLKRYKIEPSDGHAEPFLPEGISAFTCLGMVTLDLRTDDKMMVPAAKNLTSQPAAPDPQSHQVDHFHCYDANLSDGEKLPAGLQITLNDQFTGTPKTFDVKGVEHLCVAADKNQEGVKNPSAALLCYKVKTAKKQPKHKKVTKVYSTDQFAALRQDTVVESEACLPATVAIHQECSTIGEGCFTDEPQACCSGHCGGVEGNLGVCSGE